MGGCRRRDDHEVPVLVPFAIGVLDDCVAFESYGFGDRISSWLCRDDEVYDEYPLLVRIRERVDLHDPALELLAGLVAAVTAPEPDSWLELLRGGDFVLIGLRRWPNQPLFRDTDVRSA